MATGGTTPQAINASMTKWLNGPKSPGLMILEHELTNGTVQAFMDAHPVMIQTGWKLESAADLNGSSVYLNSEDNDSPVEKVNGVLVQQTYSLPVSSTSSSTPTSSTPASGGNGNATGANTSQSGKNGSTQSTMSKLAGALGTVFLTVVFYAW